MPSLWAINREGERTGTFHGDEATARMNLRDGEILVPENPEIDLREVKYDRRKKAWVPRKSLPKEYRLEDDYRYMRRTGLQDLIGDQVGVLMKIAGYALAGEPVPADVRAEFKAVTDKIEAIKGEHKKTV